MADHGTPTRYVAGCRCEACRAAHRVSNGGVRARAQFRGQTDPSKISHGTMSGYQYWKCRCDSCKAAKAGGRG